MSGRNPAAWGAAQGCGEMQEYDDYGREPQQYLSYSYNSNNGAAEATDGKYKTLAKTQQAGFY
jgi:hypothetical protein